MLKIFFDTNILEMRSGKDLTSLYKCDISKNYFDIMRFVSDNGLEEQVSLHIPLIVLMEIKQHLYETHKTKRQSLMENISNAKKLFGSVLDIGFEFKYKNYSEQETIELQIEDFVDQLVSQFLDLPINKKLKITQFPQKYDQLINRAVKRRLPFFAHNNAGITDAGFKDALLLESIINDTDFSYDEVILFTNDQRLLNKEECIDGDIHESFFVAQTCDECIALVSKKGNMLISGEIIAKLKANNYFLSRLFESIGQSLSQDTEGLNIIEIRSKDIPTEYRIKANVISNEVTFILEFEYDAVANDFSNVTYTTEND